MKYNIEITNIKGFQELLKEAQEKLQKLEEFELEYKVVVK